MQLALSTTSILYIQLSEFKTLIASVTLPIKVLSGSFDYEKDFQKQQSENLSKRSLPKILGSVDLYKYNQGLVISNSFLRYHPRPIFQSYSAYTERLATINALHLRDPQAPDNIFYDMLSIDNRYPTLDDNLSLPELLVRYSFNSQKTNELFLFFNKKKIPRTYTMIPIESGYLNFDEWRDIPNIDQLLWSEINLRKNLFGRFVSFLFKSPPIFIDVRLQDNSIESFRLIPQLAKSGFLLSPLLKSNNDLLDICVNNFRPTEKSQKITEFKVRTLPNIFSLIQFQKRGEFKLKMLKVYDDKFYPAEKFK
ncbi:hypothetical protein [Neosynechococcus sphagnicola]|uniref:hypothetical protein n=1 Tax=Neosynechococcus sphagnicola TaxID=1501145 RepID=UPI00138DD6BB|nr:hypothetical protein [Neosynechococcus sphagnicola]